MQILIRINKSSSFLISVANFLNYKNIHVNKIIKTKIRIQNKNVVIKTFLKIFKTFVIQPFLYKYVDVVYG